MEILKPSNDYVFKKIFGQKKNIEILKDLLKAILPNIEIKALIIQKDVTLERKLMENKLGILDITATLEDNTVVNIEMQVANEYNIVETFLIFLDMKTTYIPMSLPTCIKYIILSSINL